MPKLFDSMVLEIDDMPGWPIDLDISLGGEDSLGLSISMPEAPSAPTLLLCLRCLLDETDACPDREADEAPGPGVALGGAAAMGITPFPPAAAALAPKLP